MDADIPAYCRILPAWHGGLLFFHPAARDALKNAADSLYDTFARANYYINYDVQDAYYSAKSVYNRYASGGAAIEYEHNQVKAGAANVTAVYDGQPHGIAVSVSDPTENYTVTYGTEEGAYPLKVSPTLTNVTDEPLTVYYQVTAYGYDAFTGSATVTITKKAVTVAADAQEKVYGSADPELTATVTGALDGDEIEYTLSREEGEDAGEYTSNVTPCQNAKYDVTVIEGNLTITKKAVTIVAHDKSKNEGEKDPALTAGVKGTVGSDKIKYDLYRKQGETAGTYTIIVSVKANDNPNYAITAVDAVFTVNAAAEAGVVTITEEMLTVQEDGTVTVDLTAMEKEITEIVIPNAVLAKITDALEIKLAKETISFDAEAVAAIKEQVGDKDLHLELNGNEAESVRAFIVDEAGAQTDLELPAAKD